MAYIKGVFGQKGNIFVLLHHFIKKSQKTPRREIEQAERNMIDYLERNDEICLKL